MMGLKLIHFSKSGLLGPTQMTKEKKDPDYLEYPNHLPVYLGLQCREATWSPFE